MGLWNQLISELDSSDPDLQSVDSKTDRISNFLSVPLQIESLMFTGYLVCLDAFVYIFTLLPIRILLALLSLVQHLAAGNRMFGALTCSQRTDIVKGALIVCASYMLTFIDASQLYHSIRGQATIKLYVIFNVLEVIGALTEICDKLCSAFGQDILSTLFSSNLMTYQNLHLGAAVKRRLTRFTLFLVALLYVCTHCIVLFYQVMCLNVAVNSYNNALFTLLLSNQFVEIKGSVFKRFEKVNLFQLSCSGIMLLILDIVERFQLSVFLIITTLRNILQVLGVLGLTRFGSYLVESIIRLGYTVRASFADVKIFYNGLKIVADPLQLLITMKYFLSSDGMRIAYIIFLPPVLVFITEVLVDWLKHAFITKFNGIPATVYTQFRDSFYRDLSRRSSNSDEDVEPEDFAMRRTPSSIERVDKSPFLAKRIGFVSIPLACLVIRIASQFLQTLNTIEADSEDFMQDDTNMRADDDIVGTWRIPANLISWIITKEVQTSNHPFEIANFVLVLVFLVGLIFKLKLGKYLQDTATSHLASLSRRSDASTTEMYVELKMPTESADRKLDHIDRFTMVKSRIV